MATENNREIRTLKTHVAELLKWKKERESRQLKLPLDYTSVKVLGEAFRSTEFVIFNVTNLNVAQLTITGRTTVTQATSKATDVTIDSSVGTITTHNASLGAGAFETFTVNNTKVSSTDVIIVNVQLGGASGNYTVSVTDVTNGAFDITITNNSGSADSDAVDINFAVIKITT